MDTEQNKYWKDIVINNELIGEKITKGSGYFEKEYRYIKVPTGYGYDGYVFLLSEKLVNQSSDNNSWWFSICNDMKIELFYDPELREEGKRYNRHKMTGYDIVEKIFKQYEVDFKKECEERLLSKRIAKEKRDKSNIGTVVCGNYTGNFYGNSYNNYNYQNSLSAFFLSSSGTYSNHMFLKVQNVKHEFVILKMSKYHFVLYEEIINAYLNEYDMYKNMAVTITKRLAVQRKTVIHTEFIAKEQLDNCLAAMKKVRQLLQERLENLLNSDM